MPRHGTRICPHQRWIGSVPRKGRCMKASPPGTARSKPKTPRAGRRATGGLRSVLGGTEFAAASPRPGAARHWDLRSGRAAWQALTCYRKPGVPRALDLFGRCRKWRHSSGATKTCRKNDEVCLRSVTKDVAKISQNFRCSSSKPHNISHIIRSGSLRGPLRLRHD
jgi:hypothetical protein